MKYSEKSLRMIMKVIAHCKEHIQIGTRKRVWSTYFRYALGEMERNILYSSKSLIENPDQDVIYEHSIPFNMIRDKLINLDKITLESVSGILEEFHVVAQISLKDDKKLKKAGLNSKMPDDWDGKNRFARYEAVGIEIVCSKNK
jgi:hypothetical protein